jgi:hypothetical protein
MIQKMCLLTVVMLTAWQLMTAQSYNLITVGADGTETTFAVSTVQKIVFDNSAMTVNMKSGSNMTGISCVKFSDASGIEKMEVETSVLVYPNPVREYLTVSGLEKNEKINLFDVTGKLLQTVFSKENSTEIDVLSLQEGVYLLQVGYKTIKFIKQ